jgi:tape measure domain-containing protein
MAEGKDVELRIRARDYSQKTLEQVVESLEALSKAQEQQLDAAKKGEVSAKSLEDAYRRIEDAARALAKQGALIKTFEQQSEALKKVERDLEAARAAQKAYTDGLKAGEEPTKTQVRELDKLAKAVERAEGAQRRAADRVTATVDRLGEYGIAAAEVSQAQQKIVTAIGQANVALERQDTALQTLDADMRTFRQSTAAATAAEAAFQASIQSVAAAQAKAAQEAAKFEAERNDISAQNKRIAYERVWLDLLEQEDKKNAELAKSQKQLADFQAAMSAQREKERAAQLQAIEDAEKERRTLRALGDQLAQTAKGYETIARASASTRGAGGGSSSLAQSLKDIADPAAAALRNVNGVEQSLAGLTQRIGQIRGPVKDAQNLLNGLADAQKAAVAIAGQIDGYQKQVTALRASRAEYVAARTAVAELVRQLQAGTGGDDVVSKMAGARAKLKAASDAMGEQVERTRALREALRAAGVQTNDLAGTQQRLVQAVQNASKGVDQARASIQKFGVAKQEITDKIRLFNTGERTTLSYMQRLRGEVLALATSYIGLNAGIGIAQEAIAVTRDNAKIEARLVATFGGDVQRARQEIDYLRESSNRIGVSFRDSALEYTKFIAATKEAKWTVEETRFVYEQFAQAAVRTGQTNDEFKGIMLALTQMVSKGKIGAEELTQQLAERLPGAVAKLANELNLSTEDLLKKMESGSISARAVINLAQSMMKDNANAAVSAAADMIRAEAAFKNAKDQFSQAIAESGFTQAYTRFLTELAALLSSQDGKQLAKDLGDVLSLIVNILGFLARNFEEVKDVLIALVGLKAAAWLGSVAVAVRALIPLLGGMIAPLTASLGLFRVMPAAAGAAATGVTALGTALGFLGRAIPVLGALWVAWEVGTSVLSAWTKASERARAEKEKLAGGPGGMPTASKITDLENPPKPGQRGTPDPGTAVNPSQMAAQDINKALDKTQKQIDEANQAARMKGAKAELEQRQMIATEELRAMRDRAAAEIKDEKMKGETLARIDKQIAQVRLNEKLKFENQMAGATQGRVNKEKQLIEDIAREMAAVEDKLKNQETKLDPTATFEQRMKARMDAIAHEYDALMSKIGKLEKMDPKAAIGLRAKMEGFVRQRQEVEAIKVKTEELQRLEKNLADVQSLKTAKLEEQKALLEGGAIGLDTYRQRVADINETFGMGIERAIDLMRDFAQKFGKEFLDGSALDALMTRLNTAAASNQPQRDNAQANVANSEQDLNTTLERRKMLLEEVQRLKELGLLTDEQAVAKVNAINGAFRAQILEQTTALLAYIDILRAQVDPSNEQALLQLEQLRMKVQGIKLETQTAKQEFTNFEQTIIGSAAGALQNALTGIVDTIGQIIAGQQTASEGFKSFTRSVVMGFAQMLKEAALYIIKLQIIKALKSSGNPYAVAIGTAMEGSMGKKHTGGMAGSPSGSFARFSLAMPQAIPKMHTGGVVGLKNDEVMRVLQKNEEVVTRNDQRHVLNGGTQGGAAGRGTRVVLVDDRAKVPEAMASAEGDHVSIEFIRRNRATIKSMLG